MSEPQESTAPLSTPHKSFSLFGIVRLFKDYSILFLFATILEVFVLKFIPPLYTPLMWIRSIEKIANKKSPEWSYEWISYENISENVKLAIISSEDQNFPNHFGLDIKELRKAYKASQSKKKKNIRGASTITQQVAKNVFLFPARSYLRKIFELYYSLLIEVIWGKKKILETYMNVAEMGDGIYGVESASKSYYKKEPLSISKQEAASLAAILPNPRKYSVRYPSSYISRRQSWIKRQMRSLGIGYLKKIE